MLSVRRPVKEDFFEVQRIVQNYDFELPMNFADAWVIELDNKVIAFGMIRFIGEAVIICEGSDRIKIKSIDLLLEHGIRDANKLKITQLHCFVKNAMFATILKNKYSFTPIEGEALVLNLDDA